MKFKYTFCKFLFISYYYFRIGAYDSVKKFYQEATGISSGAGLMAVRVAAGRTGGRQGGLR
jgi:hypothetical protein